MSEPVRYAAYKDSGVEWIGEIPVDWRAVRLKSIMRNSSIKNHPDAEVLSLYRDLGVIPKNSRDDNHNVTSEDTGQYKFVEQGDLVINKMKAWQGSLAISDYEGIVSPAYYVCKITDKNVERKFIHYLLRSTGFTQRFECLSTGMRIGQWDLGIDDFLSEVVFLPSSNEQVKIASYLDDQCAQIDDIIASASASIEGYKQWKASVIYEAVTKGLNPDVEMKDSGVEWIGKIPNHWDTITLKNATSKIGSGKTPSGGAEVYSSEGVMFLRSQNIYNTGLVLDEVSFISEEIDEEMKNTRVHYRDVLLNITGGSIGRCCIFDNKGRANVNQHVCIIRTTQEKIIPEYLRYFWNSACGPVVVEKFQTGGNRAGLNFEQIGSVKVPWPSVKEQHKIVTYLDLQICEIDQIITEKEILISDLENYKKSLIYEVVTGKRKVK